MKNYDNLNIVECVSQLQVEIDYNFDGLQEALMHNPQLAWAIYLEHFSNQDKSEGTYLKRFLKANPSYSENAERLLDLLFLSDSALEIILKDETNRTAFFNQLPNFVGLKPYLLDLILDDNYLRHAYLIHLCFHDEKTALSFIKQHGEKIDVKMIFSYLDENVENLSLSNLIKLAPLHEYVLGYIFEKITKSNNPSKYLIELAMQDETAANLILSDPSLWIQIKDKVTVSDLYQICIKWKNITPQVFKIPEIVRKIRADDDGLKLIDLLKEQAATQTDARKVYEEAAIIPVMFAKTSSKKLELPDNIKDHWVISADTFLIPFIYDPETPEDLTHEASVKWLINKCSTNKLQIQFFIGYACPKDVHPIATPYFSGGLSYSRHEESDDLGKRKIFVIKHATPAEDVKGVFDANHIFCLNPFADTDSVLDLTYKGSTLL